MANTTAKTAVTIQVPVMVQFRVQELEKVLLSELMAATGILVSTELVRFALVKLHRELCGGFRLATPAATDSQAEAAEPTTRVAAGS
jgi:hypothetical protein